MKKQLKIRKVVYLPEKIDNKLIKYQHKLTRKLKRKISLTELITNFIKEGLK